MQGFLSLATCESAGFLLAEAGPARRLPVNICLQFDVAVQPVRDAGAGTGALRPGRPGHAAHPEGEHQGPLGPDSSHSVSLSQGAGAHVPDPAAGAAAS